MSSVKSEKRKNLRNVNGKISIFQNPNLNLSKFRSQCQINNLPKSEKGLCQVSQCDKEICPVPQVGITEPNITLASNPYSVHHILCPYSNTLTPLMHITSISLIWTHLIRDITIVVHYKLRVCVVVVLQEQ